MNERIYKKIGFKYNLNYKHIKEIYESLFSFIKEINKNQIISSLDEEDMDNFKNSFMLPRLGHLYIDKEKIRNNLKYIKAKKNEYKKD